MNGWMLAAVALFFCLLGFLLHAICFSQSKKIRSLQESDKALREALRAKEREARNTRESMIRSGRHVQMLETQLRQRNEELHDLYHGALQREERIALLERTVEEAFPSRRETKARPGISIISGRVSGSGAHPYSVVSAETKRDSIQPGRDVKPGRRKEEPLWRKKLNTILDVLREIEK